MNYYLLDHPNPNGPFYRKRRALGTLAIVIHTAESIPDIIPEDGGAEAVAAYGADTQRSVSWHTVVDSDSIVPMLPPDYEAYHVVDYNDRTVGVEIATQAKLWESLPAWWVEQALDNAAKVVAEWCQRYAIPPVFITKDQLDAGSRGITSHAQLDPKRRSDPGPDFPWDDFLFRVRMQLGLEDDMAWNQPGDAVETLVDGAKALRWQGSINPDNLPGNLVQPFGAIVNILMVLDQKVGVGSAVIDTAVRAEVERVKSVLRSV